MASAARTHSDAPLPDATRGLVLGIETSCDETAAAIVAGGRHALSNIVASQIATHAPFGGVVPELASREHLKNIAPVVHAALAQAGVTLAELDAIAVTEGPGLAGALLVGITYAKTLAFATGKPLIAINHLEGHIHAVLLEQAELEQSELDQNGTSAVDQDLNSPALALVVSGGHTHLYLARHREGNWRYRAVGRTVDDAAGEAFDKVAKLVGLGYPGGPWIDTLAGLGDARAVPFRFAEVRPRPLRQKPGGPGGSGGSGGSGGPGEAPGTAQPHETLFSFSGIKTAVLRHIESHGLGPASEARRQLLAADPEMRPSALAATRPDLCDKESLDLIASFQRAVVENLRRRTFDAAEHWGARRILVSGGVAANRELRVRFTAEAAQRNLPIAFPSLALSTDNAAMIAAAAWPKYLARDFAPDTLSAEPSLRLGR